MTLAFRALEIAVTSGKMKNWTEEEEAELVELTREGWTLRELGVKFDVSRSAIAGKQGRMDVRKGGALNYKDPWNPAKEEKPKVEFKSVLQK